MKIISCIFFLTMYSSVMALNLSDFVPGFLLPSDKTESSSVNNLPVKPLVSVKRNASSEKTWYCTRMQNGVSNVFCNKTNNVNKVMTYDGSTTSENTSGVDNSIANNNDINQSLSSRATSLQDQKVNTFLQKQQEQIQNSASLPLQPSKDVKMNINAQQVQFNIQY